MTQGHEAAWQVARTACANAVQNGNHVIAGAVVQHSGGRDRAVGLCVACGKSVEVDLGDPRPEPSGYAVGSRCVPRSRWWDSADDSYLAGLAAAARKDPTFMGYAVAAFARGKGLTDSWELAAALHINRQTLFRLELFPAIRDAPAAGGGADTRAGAIIDTARAAAVQAPDLTRLLTDARVALTVEGDRETTHQRERDIEKARQDIIEAERVLQAARARLESLVAVQHELV